MAKKVKSTRAGGEHISMAETAYQMLLDRLLSKQLVPGMIINRRGIANELKMSVAPVLEAIVQLQSEGFLESIPRKGTLVRAVHLENFRGQLLLREALECEAARLYCGEPVRKALHLEALAMEADISEKGKPFVALWKAELALHTALVELTACQPYVDAYRKVMQRKLFTSAHLFLSGEAFAGGNHVTLIRELRTDDPDRAEKLIRDHLRFKKDQLFQPVTF